MLYQYVLQNGDQFFQEKRCNYFMLLSKEISGNKRETTLSRLKRSNQFQRKLGRWKSNKKKRSGYTTGVT